MPAPTAAASFRVLNPATGALVTEYATATDLEIDVAVSRAHDVHQRDLAFPVHARTGALQRAADLLRERSTELAKLIAEEMGKPLEWMTTRSCRKGVAAYLEAAVDIEAAKEQLGHSSSRITAKFYVPAKIDRLDNSGHLDQLAGSAPKT